MSRPSLFLATIGLLACAEGADPVTPPPPPPSGGTGVASVQVAIPEQLVYPGTVLQAEAIARAGTGAVLTGLTATWISNRPTLATVSDDGEITAIAPGLVTIGATMGGVIGSSEFTIRPFTVASVEVVTPQATIIPRGTTQLVAGARRQDGEPLPGRPVSWLSVDTMIATINDAGIATGVRVGTTTIIGTIDGLSGTREVTVVPSVPVGVVIEQEAVVLSPGTTTLLTTGAPDAADNLSWPYPFPASWNSSNPAVATVVFPGVVTAVAPGVATITASVNLTWTDAIEVTVSPVPVASVTLDAATLLVNEAGSKVVRATARDAGGNPLPDRPISWSSSDPEVAAGVAWGESFVVTGLSGGTASLSATAEGREANVAVTVVPTGVDLCHDLYLATVRAADGQYLGRLGGMFDASALSHVDGVYGGGRSHTSVFNRLGRYGSATSPLSAQNLTASDPPMIIHNGRQVGYLTFNPLRVPSLSPIYFQDCE